MLLNIYIVSAVIFLASGTDGLLLCDGDCMNNTELAICRKIFDSRQPITLLGLFPCNTPAFRARGLTVAAQMAINQINRTSTLLPGYRLQLLVNNSMVGSFVKFCVWCIWKDNYVHVQIFSIKINTSIFNKIILIIGHSSNRQSDLIDYY